MQASLDLPSNPCTPPSPLLHHQALHRVNTFAPEPNPPSSDILTLKSSTSHEYVPGFGSQNSISGAKNQSPSEDGHSSRSGTPPVVPEMNQQRRKTQRITFVGFNGTEEEQEHEEENSFAAAEQVNQSTVQQRTKSSAATDARDSDRDSTLPAGGSDAEKHLEASNSRSLIEDSVAPLMGVELSATTLQSVAESAEEHEFMGSGDPELQLDRSGVATHVQREEGRGGLERGAATAVMINSVRVKSWCVLNSPLGLA